MESVYQTEKILVRDTTTYDPWIHMEEVPKKGCTPILLVGRVIYEDDKQVTLALLSNEDETVWSCLAVIPKAAIIWREGLYTR